MKKYNRQEIIELRQKGLTVREIQKKLGVSSPSVVQHHLTHDADGKDWMTKMFVFPERFPSDLGNKTDDAIIAGFNEYRRLVIEKIELSKGKE